MQKVQYNMIIALKSCLDNSEPFMIEYYQIYLLPSSIKSERIYGLVQIHDFHLYFVNLSQITKQKMQNKYVKRQQNCLLFETIYILEYIGKCSKFRHNEQSEYL